MTETVTEIKPADPYLTVKVKMPGQEKAEDKELMMSAGLLRRVVAIASGAGDITEIYANPHIQQVILVEILQPRTEHGKKRENLSLDDFEMLPEEADKIVTWAGSHILNFFSGAVNNIKSAVSDQGSLKTLTDSLNGLANSVQTKPSAGASTVESPK